MRYAHMAPAHLEAAVQLNPLRLLAERKKDPPTGTKEPPAQGDDRSAAGSEPSREI